MPPKKDDEEDSGMGKMMRDTLFTASNNLVEKMDEKSEAAREKAMAQFGAVVKTYFDLDGQAKNAVKVLRLALMSTPRGRQAADKATRDNLWDEMTNASKLVAALRVALDWQPLTWQRITQLVPINPQANIAERWQMFEELASAKNVNTIKTSYLRANFMMCDLIVTRTLADNRSLRYVSRHLILIGQCKLFTASNGARPPQPQQQPSVSTHSTNSATHAMSSSATSASAMQIDNTSPNNMTCSTSTTANANADESMLF
jgi:hypothetical protein